MAIEGPLKELSIEDVLQLLELSRKTGVLMVRSERLNDEALVHFDRGAVVFAVRRRSNRRLGQQLQRAGKVTERELERALELQRQDPIRRLGEILLEMGSVTSEELDRQLQFQVEETVYDLMAWDEGYFKFEDTPEIRVERQSVRVRVESLLMEGARRIDEWTRLESKIPGLDSVPVLAVHDDGESPPLELRPEEWEVLAEVDGERDLRQIAADTGQSTFDVAKIIYGLVNTGVVRVEDRPSRLPERELAAAIHEIEELLGKGDAEAAGRMAADLQSAYPERPELSLLSGRALAAQGRMRAATEALAKAAAQDPLSAEAHYHLGFAAVRTGDLERAARAWDRFLRLEPNGDGRSVVQEGLRAVQALNHILEKETR